MKNRKRPKTLQEKKDIKTENYKKTLPGPKTYREAGVDIEMGEKIVSFIRNLNSPAIGNEIGAFSAGFQVDTSVYREPVILTTTDGVGTKILIAREFKKFDTIGIDLVAMCVNDLLVSGAVPLLFLDYIAAGKLEEDTLSPVIRGIVRGCEIAQCKLTGGETAELPDMYKNDDFDLAGFSVGIAEKSSLLPKKEKIKNGDKIFGLPSSGIHSNGLSLARKSIPRDKKELRKKLLEPTRIYVTEMRKIISSGFILAASHVTGGGIVSNLSRVIPQHLKPNLNYSWNVPDIFKAIQAEGNISTEEMYKVFNMGIGIAVVIGKENKNDFVDFCHTNGIDILYMGEIIDG